jgi:hypothetical protein
MKNCAICPHQNDCLKVGACLDDLNAPLIASGQFPRRMTPDQAHGFTAALTVMRVWQVAGGSVSNEPTGWKMLRLDEATGASITKQRSLAPRPGYKSGDKAMKVITCQL